jgi:hypothetical protein
VIRGHAVVEALGEAEHGVAVRPLDMAPGGTRLRACKAAAFTLVL